MGFEIERKFLVRSDAWRKRVTRTIAIRQAYLATEGNASVRVRIRDNATATLSVKSRPASLRRLELEFPISVIEAEAMIPLRHGAVIEKVRHLVPHGDLTFEVDVFSGENEGLVIAEIELRDEHQEIALPEWTGIEITGQLQYYNSALVTRPSTSWSQPATAERSA
ncbi:MAG: CYTH domain-containing protein [Pseudorhodoplanes sp.]|uniref:CYTH domain-containing protein n=1 Tax=Pseudorhodoplanes sp. TaxID=1934341 RepID=UPI003D0C6BD4